MYSILHFFEAQQPKRLQVAVTKSIQNRSCFSITLNNGSLLIYQRSMFGDFCPWKIISDSDSEGLNLYIYAGHLIQLRKVMRKRVEFNLEYSFPMLHNQFPAPAYIAGVRRRTAFQESLDDSSLNHLRIE